MNTRSASPKLRYLSAVLASAIGCAHVLAQTPPRFPPGSVWHTNVATAPLHPLSADMLAALAGLGGWGNGNRMQIDFSITVVHAAAPGSPLVPIVPRIDSGEYYLPDCEALPTSMPVPPGSLFEGFPPATTCDNVNEDCHLLVQQGNRLFEIYSGNLTNNQLDARCLAVWELDRVYPPEGRGDHCTGADAAGFPIAPLLVNADEIDAVDQLPDADLGHAIRFILPNARMATFPDGPDPGTARDPLYVRPATHAGGPVGPENTVPYGVRMRLRPDFNMSGYNPAARVVLRTMQRYGIVLSDGGNIALTFENDSGTTTKWTDLAIEAREFSDGAGAGAGAPVLVTDFQIIDTGPRILETYNCVRSVLPPITGTIFVNGFE